MRELWRFLRRQAHLLRREPEQLYQLAANQPAGSAPAIAAASSAGTTRRPWLHWVNRAQTSDPCLAVLAGHKGAVVACCVSPGGDRIASVALDGLMRVWDAVDGQLLATLQLKQERRSDPGRICAFSPDGSRLLTAAADGPVTVWELGSGQQVIELDGRAPACWSPDGRRVLAASDEARLTVWDAASTEIVTQRPLLELRELPSLSVIRACHGRAGGFADCRFTRDGTHLVAVADDGTLHLWDVTSGEGVLVFHGPQALLSVACPPGGRTLLAVDAPGALLRFALRGLEPGPPIVTATRLVRLDHGRSHWRPLVRCGGCARTSYPTEQSLAAIAEHERQCGIGHGESPIERLSAAAWSDPRLLVTCPHCEGALRLNPFIAQDAA